MMALSKPIARNVSGLDLLRRFAISVCVILSMLTIGRQSAVSEELDAAQTSALQARVEGFSAIIAKGDMAAVFDYMPPKVLQEFAKQTGASIDQIKAATTTQMEQVMKTVTFDSFTMDLKSSKAGKLADGMIYTLIPTETRMSVESAGKVRATSETLALNDAGVWYLVRIDTPAQSDLVKKIYPGFADIEFKPGTMEPVK
jgi:ketosteroid isomerase-like protein